jgi:hypothetical protein
MVAVVFPYLCFGKKSFNLLNTERRPTVLLRRPTNASWNSSKVLDTEEGSDGKFSSSEQMMLGQLSVRTKYHVVWTDAMDPNSLT